MPATPALGGLARSIAVSLRPAWLYSDLEVILFGLHRKKNLHCLKKSLYWTGWLSADIKEFLLPYLEDSIGIFLNKKLFFRVLLWNTFRWKMSGMCLQMIWSRIHIQASNMNGIKLATNRSLLGWTIDTWKLVMLFRLLLMYLRFFYNSMWKSLL